jgi:hypothetical protein
MSGDQKKALPPVAEALPKRSDFGKKTGSGNPRKELQSAPPAAGLDGSPMPALQNSWEDD